MTKPSDRAIAQVFWKAVDLAEKFPSRDYDNCLRAIAQDARDIDAAAPVGRIGHVGSDKAALRDAVARFAAPKGAQGVVPKRTGETRFDGRPRYTQGCAMDKLFTVLDTMEREGGSASARWRILGEAIDILIDSEGTTQPRPTDSTYYLCEREHVEDESRPLTQLFVGMRFEDKVVLVRQCGTDSPQDRAQREQLNWQSAVLDALADTCQDFPVGTPPKQIIEAIISWHVQVALDPRVSEVARDREDADRYRWLREESLERNSAEGGAPWPVIVKREHGVPTMVGCFEIELDAAIDAARAGEGGSK